jgi:hypothetical protein
VRIRNHLQQRADGQHAAVTGDRDTGSCGQLLHRGALVGLVLARHGRRQRVEDRLGRLPEEWTEQLSRDGSPRAEILRALDTGLRFARRDARSCVTSRSAGVERP